MKAKADASMAAYNRKWAAAGQKDKENQRKLNAYDSLVSQNRKLMTVKNAALALLAGVEGLMSSGEDNDDVHHTCSKDVKRLKAAIAQAEAR